MFEEEERLRHERVEVDQVRVSLVLYVWKTCLLLNSHMASCSQAGSGLA
jgi:hypothetical protein